MTLVTCLPTVLNAAEVALGQLCPPAGPGPVRQPCGMHAMLRRVSSSHPGQQRLLSLTYAGKDLGRLYDE